MTTLQRIFLEPISALLHLVAALLAAVGLLLLIVLTWHQPAKMLSLVVYGLSLVSLFTASTLLHGLKVAGRWREWLKRLDHAAIFLLIAGTYTPILYNLIPPRWRWPLLGTIWLVALAGILHKLTGVRIDGFWNVSIYLIVGWGGVLPLALALPLARTFTPGGLALLLVGGLIYSAGFVVYYLQWPDPWPARFGHHEIWHLFVIGATLCHYLFMLFYVAPGS